jgi:glucokinase
VVAVPGRVDYRSGRLEYAPNLPAQWTSMLQESFLESRLGVEVALANDADAAAVGEAYFGAGRDFDDVVYVTVSTGVGAGVVLSGRLMSGGRSAAEVGHTVIDRVAAAAGAPSTVEDLASSTALERSAIATGLPADGQRIVELVSGDDPRAVTIWHELVDALVVGVANLAHVFAPQVIVLGGGVGMNADLLLRPIRDHLEHEGPRELAEEIRVVTAALGDDAGLAGAAAWGDATHFDRASRSPEVGAVDEEMSQVSQQRRSA